MNNLVAYLSLLVFTGLAAWLAHASPENLRLPLILMLLSGVKFLIVGFRFMDLRRAHKAWQAGLVGFTVLFLTLFLFAAR